MRNLKIHARQENGVLSHKCGIQPDCHEGRHVCIIAGLKINILLSVLIFFFLFYDFDLNAQGFVYLEIVKYQLGLHRKVRVLVK